MFRNSFFFPVQDRPAPIVLICPPSPNIYTPSKRFDRNQQAGHTKGMALDTVSSTRYPTGLGGTPQTGSMLGFVQFCRCNSGGCGGFQQSPIHLSRTDWKVPLLPTSDGGTSRCLGAARSEQECVPHNANALERLTTPHPPPPGTSPLGPRFCGTNQNLPKRKRKYGPCLVWLTNLWVRDQICCKCLP